MTPVFPHGGLRLYLLFLLSERPQHGYELIQEFGTRFGGTYTPSAGTIYPRLAKLEEEGLVEKVSDGRKTVYSLTAAGRAELDSRREELAALERGVTDTVRTLAAEVREGVAGAMRSLRAELAAAAREARGAASGVTDPVAAPPAEGERDDTAWDNGTDKGTENGAAANGAATGTGERGGPSDGAHQGDRAEADTGSASGLGSLEARMHLQEIDLLLNGFRADVRGELGRRAREGSLAPDAAARLRAGLDGLRGSL